jgi:CO/xanthine dehydrogenase Mo-binding subunit
MTPHQLRDHADLLAHSVARTDAADKLTGNPGFLSDRIRAGQLFGAILGSPHAHARILAIDTSAALQCPGVQAVVTAADIPGVKQHGMRIIDRPFLCIDKVRCIADPVAAVAADTPEQARHALSCIRVDYELLPLVDSMDTALLPDAAPLHASGNLLHATQYQRGDLAAAQARCAHVVTADYETPRQMHAFLETEGGVAEADGAGADLRSLHLYFGCQNPQRDRQVIAAMLALSPDQVHALGTPVGGSFGGKDDLTIQPIAALLAWKTGRAVRMHLTRSESVDSGIKRHAMQIRMHSGCDAQGRLLFHVAEILADTGAYASLGPEVLDAAHEHAIGPYRFEAVDISGRLAYTNNGIAGAFRGFGAVQSQFALERQIDALAALAGFDAIEFRRINLLEPDAPGPLGQVVAPFDGPQRVIDVLSQHPLWLAREAIHAGSRSGRYRRGVGVALVHRSDGFGRGGPTAGRMALALAADGKIELRTSLVEMGQNLLDTIRVLCAHQLGCDVADIRAVIGDTSLTPDSGSASASRSTTLVHHALALQGPPWSRRLCELAATVLQDTPASTLQLVAGGIADVTGLLCMPYRELALALGESRLPADFVDVLPEDTPSDIDGAHFVFGACGALAQVCIDTWTGALRVEKFALTAALGPVVSAMGFLGQMEGGALIGQGMATTESLPMQDGHYLARNLDTYLIPTLADAPAMDIRAMENLLPGDTIGPRGAGEISTNIAAAAIPNAVFAAIGMAVNCLPLSADAVLDFLEKTP